MVARRRADIERRYKAKQTKRQPISIAALRIAELHRLFRHRYGHVLPDDDSGRDDVQIMAHHLAKLADNPRKRIKSFVELSAPWMTANETAALIDRITSQPIRWRADKLAHRLNLTEVDRRQLGIRTIGAVDMSKQEREQARKLRDRQRKRQKRRAAKKQLRADYIATHSTNRTKPWIAAGISRRSWYRRHGTSPSAI